MRNPALFLRAMFVSLATTIRLRSKTPLGESPRTVAELSA